jgi:hypothetical protein
VHSTGSFLDKKYTRQNAVVRPYKTTQVKVTEDGKYERRTHFYRQYMTVFLTQNLYISMMKLCSL